MLAWANSQLERLSETLAPQSNDPGYRFTKAVREGNENEAMSIMTNELDPMQRVNERKGSLAVHMAAQFGAERVLREMLLPQYAESFDVDGNTPLHYASMGGQLSTCKMLIQEFHVSVVVKNARGETAYDLASLDSIRQYLLPIQLQRETQECLDNGGAGLIPGMDLGGLRVSVPAPPVHSNSAPVGFSPPPAAPAPNHTPVAPVSSQSLPASQHHPPAVSAGAGAGAVSSAPSSSTYARSGFSSAAVGNSKYRPDGFHSSSSDKNLQLKYGHDASITGPPSGNLHTQPVAPPPMIAATASRGSVFGAKSRYPTYDAQSNTTSSFSPPVTAPSNPTPMATPQYQIFSQPSAQNTQHYTQQHTQQPQYPNQHSYHNDNQYQSQQQQQYDYASQTQYGYQQPQTYAAYPHQTTAPTQQTAFADTHAAYSQHQQQYDYASQTHYENQQSQAYTAYPQQTSVHAQQTVTADPHAAHPQQQQQYDYASQTQYEYQQTQTDSAYTHQTSASGQETAPTVQETTVTHQHAVATAVTADVVAETASLAVNDSATAPSASKTDIPPTVLSPSKPSSQPYEDAGAFFAASPQKIPEINIANPQPSSENSTNNTTPPVADFLAVSSQTSSGALDVFAAPPPESNSTSNSTYSNVNVDPNQPVPTPTNSMTPVKTSNHTTVSQPESTAQSLANTDSVSPPLTESKPPATPNQILAPQQLNSETDAKDFFGGMTSPVDVGRNQSTSNISSTTHSFAAKSSPTKIASSTAQNVASEAAGFFGSSSSASKVSVTTTSQTTNIEPSPSLHQTSASESDVSGGSFGLPPPPMFSNAPNDSNEYADIDLNMDSLPPPPMMDIPLTQ